MRVGCLLVPNLPLVAQLRAHPELAGLPVIVVSESGPRATVLAVSDEARRAGVRPGSSSVHARTLCAALRVRTASPALEHAARQALLDVALSVSAHAETAPPGSGARCGESAVLLDASGSGALFGSETGLASALVVRAAALGLPGVAAVASSRFLARLVARSLVAGAGTRRVLAPGEEAAFLAPLPLDLVDPDDALAELLTRFGIHRLGALLALPSRAVTTRLGAEARLLVSRLRGEEPELPLPVPRALRLEEEADLEAPVDRLEPLLFVLRGALSRLCARLAVRHLACASIDLVLGLTDGRREARRIGLAAPTLDERILLRRLHFCLEALPAAGEIESMALAAEGCPPRSDQLDLFRPAGPAPAALDALVAELEALCGPGRIGAPQVPDDLRPGAFAMGPFHPAQRNEAERSPEQAGPAGAQRGAAERSPEQAGPAGAQRGAAERSLDTPAKVGEARASLALRALRPPVPAQVRIRAGRPQRLRSAVANGDVVRCAGPWRTTGGWWCPEGRFAFDHFDVHTSDGLVVRLRLDRLRSVWHVDAVYD